MTDEQLEKWNALSDWQMTLQILCNPVDRGGLGLTLEEIAAAELDGVAPAHAWVVTGAPMVQTAVERLSRRRLQESNDRLVEALTRWEGVFGRGLAALEARTANPAAPVAPPAASVPTAPGAVPGRKSK